MIIENGSIEFKDKGRSSDWCLPIACQYIPKTSYIPGVSNGERAELTTYTVLIDIMDMSTFAKARLSDEYGRVLGEYVIKSIEHLQAVHETRLTIG